jgi:adenylosuccinate synthase
MTERKNKMPVKVVVGAQWGDEGKGKIIDTLAEQADLVVRFQGGDNAGHTVVNGFGAFKLHIVPCGIFNSDCFSLVGTGMVVNPDELLVELGEISTAGVSTDGLRISAKANILMPWHVELDCLAEKLGNIGTTKRGIGPAYADRAMRTNLRFEDLLDLDYAAERVKKVLPEINSRLGLLGGKQYSLEETVNQCNMWAEALGSRLVDPIDFVHDFLARGRRILFEGQLGAMKDIDLGIYPYVTSSNPVAAYAAVSAGIPARHITEVTGVLKALSSAVGNGPFPTEMLPGEADVLRGTGEHVDDEFGARTGRARRLGWLDLPIVQYANKINGFTELALCKLDKLDNLPEIKVCTGYEFNGKIIGSMPNIREMALIKPVYATLPGWLQNTREIKSIDKLPENALKYIKFIEAAVGVPVTMVGVGPGREELAWKR